MEWCDKLFERGARLDVWTAIHGWTSTIPGGEPPADYLIKKLEYEAHSEARNVRGSDSHSRNHYRQQYVTAWIDVLVDLKHYAEFLRNQES